MSKLKSSKSSLLLGILLFFGVGLLSQPSQAAELGGVSLPDSVEIDGKTRLLNGLGMRLATIFKVKVYVAGLYVATKSTDAAQLLADADSKLVRMSMLRDLDAKQLNEAFSEGFQKACRGEECKKFDVPVKNFVALLPAMKKGEILDFELRAESVVVKKGSDILGRVSEAGLSPIILRIWIGDAPPNSELKAGLLGRI